MNEPHKGTNDQQCCSYGSSCASCAYWRKSYGYYLYCYTVRRSTSHASQLQAHRACLMRCAAPCCSRKLQLNLLKWCGAQACRCNLPRSASTHTHCSSPLMLKGQDLEILPPRPGPLLPSACSINPEARCSLCLQTCGAPSRSPCPRTLPQANIATVSKANQESSILHSLITRRWWFHMRSTVASMHADHDALDHIDASLPPQHAAQQ